MFGLPRIKLRRRGYLPSDDRRPLMLYKWADLPPLYEETDEMGIDEHGYFFYNMRGPGGGYRGLVCGRTDDCCTGECFKKNALYFTLDGKPLFFCRYFYTVFKGEKYVEKDELKELGFKLTQILRGEQ